MHKRWRHIGVLAALIMLIALIAVNYLVSRYLNRLDYPFNVPAETSVFRLDKSAVDRGKTVEAMPSDLVLLDEFHDITIITTDSGWDYAAIYDPGFRYARNMRTQQLGLMRYFSQTDYDNRTPVSALVLDPQKMNPTMWFDTNLGENSFGLRYLFAIDDQSELYADGIREMRNFTSLNTWGDTLYLIPGEHATTRNVKNFLTDRGYRETPLIDMSTFQLVVQSVKSGMKEIYFFAIAFSQYLIFIFVVNGLFLREKRALKIHQLSGGITKSALHFLKHSNYALLVPHALVILCFVLAKRSPYFFAVAWSDFVLYLMLHLIVLNVIFLISFAANFVRVRKLNIGSV